MINVIAATVIALLLISWYVVRFEKVYKYDINLAKIGDKVQPIGIELEAPLAWTVVDFIECNGQRVKTVIQHPISGDLIALEFI